MFHTRILTVAFCLVVAPLCAQEPAEEPNAGQLMQKALSQLEAEEYGKAAESFRAVVEVAPNNGRAWHLLGYSLHADGKLDEAIPVHEKATEFEESKRIALYNLGCVYALKGNKDKAFEYLHKAIDAKFKDASYYKSDPDLASLREDDRYGKVLARIKDADHTGHDDHGPHLSGTWQMKSGKRAGAESERMPPSITVTKKVFIIPSEEADLPFVMAYKLDHKKSPMQIDFEIESGPVEEGSAQGILKIDEGTMTLCYDPTGESRPESFESTEDNGNFMFVMKREKMDAKKLIGVWDIQSGSRAGEDVPAERLSTEGGVTISEDTITLPAGPDMVFVMGYKVNGEKTPAEIDMEIKSGPAPEGSQALGIVEISDGKVMLCYDSTGEQRPEEFKTSEEDGFFMFTLQERKKE